MKHLTAWPVDSLTKIFPDDAPPRRAPRQIEILAARGAVESAQLALRVDQDCPDLEISIEPPRAGGKGGAVLTDLRWRRVEYVPVRRPAWYLHPSQRLRSVPSFFPDPLIDPEMFDVFYKKPDGGQSPAIRFVGGVTTPLWLTLRAPEDAAPGAYRGAVKVKMGRGSVALPLIVEVSPAQLPRARTLKLTQWFSAAQIAEVCKVEPWSEEHWSKLAVWGRNMAQHRMNVVFSSLVELLLLSRDAAGKLAVDFSRFDRWVRTFQEAGVIGMIEGGHLATRGGDWSSAFVLLNFAIRLADGAIRTMRGTPVEDPRARAFLTELLGQLVSHLSERGWLSSYYQHLADEPIPANAGSYRVLSDMVQELAPQLPRLDAIMADEGLIGTATVWCPQSQEAEAHRAMFQARQAAGEEVWHYTCLAPSGEYPNRFIAQPLLGTRVLHWFNFTAGLSGYLHWGLNHWKDRAKILDPFCNTDQTTFFGQQCLPGGDSHVVYPGGPAGAPFDSIRYEMCLEGAQDYELLKIAAAVRPQAAMRLAKTVVPTLKRYLKDPARFRIARRKLLALVAEAQRTRTVG